MADRNYEGIAAGLGVISSRIEEGRKRREEAYKSDREFQQRLQAAGIAAGRLEPIIQGGRITGVQPTTPFNPVREWTRPGTTIGDIESGRAGPGTILLSPGQTYSQRVGGGTLTSRGPTLTEQAYANKLGMASALAPLPTVTPPGGFEQEGFAPSEVGHPQTQRLLRNRLGAMQQVGLASRPPASARPKTPNMTEQFRGDIQDAIAAISSGAISKDEALQRLIDAYPDKVNVIRQLEFSLF